MLWGLLGAPSDFNFNGGDCVSLGVVSWRRPVRLGPSLPWVLELEAGSGSARVLGSGREIQLTPTMVFLIDDGGPFRL